jgi:hypothetical protein
MTSDLLALRDFKEPTPQEYEKFAPQIKIEIALLTNVSKFMRRVQNIVADEALQFVECSEYVTLKIKILKRQELMRLEMAAKMAEEQKKIATEKAKAEAIKAAEAQPKSEAPKPSEIKDPTAN